MSFCLFFFARKSKNTVKKRLVMLVKNSLIKENQVVEDNSFFSFFHLRPLGSAACRSTSRRVVHPEVQVCYASTNQYNTDGYSDAEDKVYLIC